jgi:DNA-binding NtrC family response regulator
MTLSTEIVLRLLIIDGDVTLAALMQEALAGEPVDVMSAVDIAAGLNLIRVKRPSIVFIEVPEDGSDGFGTLDSILEVDPGIDVILMTKHYSTDEAVKAIKRGACDYLTKPISVERLRETVGQLLSDAKVRQHSLELEGKMVDAFQFEGMIGRSPLMLELFRKINRVARHFQTILVTGQTGTGKELVAKALHRLGSRPKGTFLACNCSAWAETLLETELFGSVRGAFTGATHDRQGVFEHAKGGTLFLDEIGEMPHQSQAKLLRALQNQEIQRVGSPIVHKVDVRVIAATSRNLLQMVTEGKFREDLFYRLSMIEIEVPPLVDRREDLPLLERYLVHAFALQAEKHIRGLTRRAQTALHRYPWPGNVRELENVIGHACIMSERDIIDIQDLPERFQLLQAARSPLDDREEIISLHEMESRYSRQVVAKVSSKTRAAELLGISRSKLYRLMAGYTSDRPVAPLSAKEIASIEIV